MKKTINKNPLIEYLTSNKNKPGQSKSKKIEEHKINEVKPAVSVQKQRVTIHISVELIERVKNAVYWEPGLTVASFAEQAFLKAIEKLEKEKGKKYPSRRQSLRGGRPLK